MKKLSKKQLAAVHFKTGNAKPIISRMINKAERFGHLNRPKYRLRPCESGHRGGRGVIADHRQGFKSVLELLGYEYTQGNDAARGGLNGEYIIISRKAFDTLKAIESGVYTELVKEKL